MLTHISNACRSGLFKKCKKCTLRTILKKLIFSFNNLVHFLFKEALANKKNLCHDVIYKVRIIKKFDQKVFI